MTHRGRSSLGLLVFFVFLLPRPSDLKSYYEHHPRFGQNSNECSCLNFEDCARKTCTGAEEKYVVCYFTNWAWYRSEPVNFRPENINASLCSHIFYAFSSLDVTTLLMTYSDSWADIDNEFYKLVTAFKAKGVKVLLSIGGWNNSGGSHWSTLVNNATVRANFISAAVAFLKTYEFQGLDINYEYPGCPQGNYTGGLPTDKKNFNVFVSELKKAFNKEFLLTVTTAAGEKIIKGCYHNMAELCYLADWINVMTYDYYGYADLITGPNAPICGTGSAWGVFDTIRYYRYVLKCPAEKLVMGIPLYGKSYTMEDSSDPKFGVTASGAGTAGSYTQSAGTLAYYEVCSKINEGWKHGFNKINGSYAWNGTEFISFDREIDIIRKTCLINKQFNLKGAMVWDLDFDDFNDICGHGSYPLLRTLNHHLRC